MSNSLLDPSAQCSSEQQGKERHADVEGKQRVSQPPRGLKEWEHEVIVSNLKWYYSFHERCPSERSTPSFVHSCCLLYLFVP